MLFLFTLFFDFIKKRKKIMTIKLKNTKKKISEKYGTNPDDNDLKLKYNCCINKFRFSTKLKKLFTLARSTPLLYSCSFLRKKSIRIGNRIIKFEIKYIFFL